MSGSVVRIKHAPLRHKLDQLAEEAKARFLKIDYFPSSQWEYSNWLYLKNKKSISFSGQVTLTDEMVLLSKIFVVTYLWGSRGRSTPLGFSRVSELQAAVRLLATTGVSDLEDIDQDSYDSAIRYIKERYVGGAGLCNTLNILIRYLSKNDLLIGPINTVRGGSHFKRTDEYGRVALAEKLPLPELVRAVIHLKWAIDDQWDGSIRAQIDMLSILTQAFQYGLGLRIGEVLRLPKNCLVEIDGELFCRVWTEKGAEPVARYVPTIWREVLKDAVSRINIICNPFRLQAEAIETDALSRQLDARFQQRIKSIDADVQRALDDLAHLSTMNGVIARKRLILLQPLTDEDLIELKCLGQYLPFTTTAKDTCSLTTFYRAFGLNFRSIPMGLRKHRHFTSGADVNKKIAEVVELRMSVFTYAEVYTLIQGIPHSGSTRTNQYLKGLKSSIELNIIERYAFFGPELRQLPSLGYVDYDSAVKLIKRAVGGGYEYDKFLPMLDAEELYPEFFNQKTMTSINDKKHSGFFSYLRVSDSRVTFFRKAAVSNRLSYAAGNGYLLDYSSITEAVKKTFVALNTDIQAALVEEVMPEVLEEGLTLASQSFTINQKVSDYLFVAPSSAGSIYNEHIPCVMGYPTLIYSLNPKAKHATSAFIRYSVTVDDDVITSFQTHKGRHWQTNSLFRAGLSASIVNKWMGRTEVQGDHYDHQTARERSSRVGELMLSQQGRFLGDLPEQLRIWKSQEIPLHDLEAHLNNAIRTAHYSPLGFCIRDINLKPCEYHLKCLTGNKGLGCREFVFDLHDRIQRRNIETERDKAETELARLFEFLNRTDVPTESVEMHIEHQMTIYRNATAVLERSELILTQAQADDLLDFQPFRTEGSKPDDCAFQCGEQA